LSKAGLGGLDRWLGFLFGLIRGFFIVLILYVGAVVVAEGESKLPGMVTDATITPMLRDSAHLMSGMLPTEMAKRITDNLPGASETTKDIQEAGENLGKAGDSMGEASGSGLDLLQDETGN
ncbi:MAG: CvpA family protein, partial [Rhodobiaceae bacterium]